MPCSVRHVQAVGLLGERPNADFLELDQKTQEAFWCAPGNRRRMAGGPPLDAEEMPRWTSTLEAKAKEVPLVECQPSGDSAPPSTLEAKAKEVPLVECQPSGDSAPHRTLEASLRQPVPLGPPVPLAPTNNTVQHSFVHMNLHPDWLSYPHQLHIDINKARMVRVNGGPWHGTAIYGHTGGAGGHWTLWFNCKADVSNVKAIKYVQIPGTKSYLHAHVGPPGYNSMLIPKVYERTHAQLRQC
jgi:hypothetical protein